MIKDKFYDDSLAADPAHALPWKAFGPHGNDIFWTDHRKTLADNHIRGEFEMMVIMDIDDELE